MNRSNFLKTDIKGGILKADISDHFTLFLISMTTRTNKKSAMTFIKRRNINSETLQEFKQMLSLVDWDAVTKLQDVNAAYNRVL